jgi:hypothetical protein
LPGHISEHTGRPPPSISTARFFASWEAWCKRSGEHAGGVKTFVRTLESRGFARDRKEDGRGFRGLAVNPRAGDPYWL